MLTAAVQITRGNTSTWHKIHDMDRSKHGYIVSWNLMFTAKSRGEEKYVCAFREMLKPHGR